MSAQNSTESSSFDWSPALSFVDGDDELLRDVVEAFLEECPVLMGSMQEAINRRDAPVLRRSAHVMASAMRTFGLPGAQDAAQRLEDLGRVNQFDQAPRYYAELKRYVDVVIPAASALVHQAGEC